MSASVLRNTCALLLLWCHFFLRLNEISEIYTIQRTDNLHMNQPTKVPFYKFRSWQNSLVNDIALGTHTVEYMSLALDFCSSGRVKMYSFNLPPFCRLSATTLAREEKNHRNIVVTTPQQELFRKTIRTNPCLKML